MDPYNKKTAFHYAAYRPPLHSIILKRVLPNSSTFPSGLDVGCGTGYSTLALVNYCSNLVGIDPSHSMLDRATKHQKITYKPGSGEDIPLPDHSVDIITFAGSLFYTDLEKAGQEIRRVGKKDAVIISYDFEILLEDILDRFELHREKTESEYDHSINFSGMESFHEIVVKREQVNLEFTGSQLAHVLLSEYHLYKKISDRYSTETPFEKLKDLLVKAGNHFMIKAKIFCSKYHVSKE